MKKKKICPYYANLHCLLLKVKLPCEADASKPQTCADYVHRQKLYGVVNG